MPMTLIYFLLGAVAMGIVMIPFLRRTPGAPATPADPAASPPAETPATPAGDARCAMRVSGARCGTTRSRARLRAS